jgi:enoyl-[acyl-carrier protein] reductase III
VSARIDRSGEVVLITGGSRGIGRAVALRLAEEKPRHIVIAYSMNHAAARQTVADLGALGVEATAVPTDVSAPEMLKELFAMVRERFGRLDIFVSNAARSTFHPVLDFSVRIWQRVMDLNALPFLVGSQLAAGIMRDNGGGKIVGVSSLGSTFYIPRYGGLGAAKAVVESLARYLAIELAPLGINVNVVSGGFVDTESMRLNPEYEEVKAYCASRVPTGRVGQPEDLAGVIAFLCSPEASWIQGQTVIVDGGMSLVL